MGRRWRVKIDCLRNNPAVALPVPSRNDSASTRGGIKIPLWASSNRSGSTEGYLFVLSPSSQASCSGPLAYLRRPSRIRTPSPWVASLLVLPLHRGKKIGSYLVRQAEMLLKTNVLSQPNSSSNSTSGSARVLACNFRRPAGKLCSRDPNTRGAPQLRDLPPNPGSQCPFRNDL